MHNCSLEPSENNTKPLKNASFFSILIKIIPSVLLVFASVTANAQDTIVTRFANPLYYCDSEEYCVDVQFQSLVPGHVIFGVNVRFFYPEDKLHFLDFRNFQGGYSAFDPDPPTLKTILQPAGMNLFGVEGVVTLVNGAILLSNPNQPIFLDTNFTTLFTVCFELDESEQNQTDFCPPLIWNLEQDPANGGWQPGDDGLVITLVDPEDDNFSIPATEIVDQFNWQYIGNGGQPFGEPISELCIYPHSKADIASIPGPVCYLSNVVVNPVSPLMPGVHYAWDFGQDAIPPTAEGYGPHNVKYSTSGTKTISLSLTPEVEGTFCPDMATTTLLVNSCPGVVSGSVLSDTGAPIAGVVINLCHDNDYDGQPEAIYKTVITNGAGTYTMVDLFPGNYVLQQMQPIGWYSISDVDLTEDFDSVPNISLTDNLLPVTVEPGEFDNQNRFIESANPGAISGNVFIDLNGNQTPDPGEGIAGVSIELYADANTDGIPDSGTPMQTTASSPAGTFIFSSVSIGSYVLKEIQPGGYFSVKDFDATNDLDIVANTNMTDDLIPVTLLINEHDQDNFFIEGIACQLIVSNTNDSGSGSLRDAIECALPGQTISFAVSMANKTIMINSDVLHIDKEITIDASNVPTMIIASGVPGLFEIGTSGDVNFLNVHMRGGLQGSDAGAIYNLGSVRLEGSTVYCNPIVPNHTLVFNDGGEINFVGVSNVICD